MGFYNGFPVSWGKNQNQIVHTSNSTNNGSVIRYLVVNSG